VEVVASTDKKIESCCRNVQRHLRLAISDWYHYLSRLALDSDTWLYECEWWMKNVPSQLDLPWAFESLSSVVNNPTMLDIFVVKVDEICLCIERNGGEDLPKSVHELRSSLQVLQKELSNADMAV
tara:strand:+ start:298 stop:672 length:375 start_codon:yes stop_codon:yes gene_type:complete